MEILLAGTSSRHDNIGLSPVEMACNSTNLHWWDTSIALCERRLHQMEWPSFYDKSWDDTICTSSRFPRETPTQMDFHCGVSRSTKALFAQMHSSLAVPCPLQVDSHTCSFHPSFPVFLFGHHAPQEPFFYELDLIYSWRNLDALNTFHKHKLHDPCKQRPALFHSWPLYLQLQIELLPRFADLLFSEWQ